MGYIKKIKNRLAEIPVVQTWYLKRRHKDRIVDLESGLNPESHNKAKRRWLESKPDSHLTWDKEVPGGAFIEKVQQFANVDSTTRILEIGPGYGRLLKAVLDSSLDFKDYYGIDISSQNIKHLNKKFGNDTRIHFLEGDIEVIRIDSIFDLMISSLTLKHLFPSFQKGLANISLHLSKGGMAIFDLIEGNSAFHEEDGTFIRLYSREQVKEIVESCDLRLVAFDKVTHAEGYTRLLAICKK